MATKAELQAAHERCEAAHREAAAGASAHDYPAAVRHAEGVLPDQHAAVTYGRRFRPAEPAAAPLADLILRYAPACFLGRSLDAVETWYVGGTKTERAALPDLPARLAGAHDALAHAAALWAVLAESPAAALRPGPDPRADAVLRLWLAAGAAAAHPTVRGAYVRVSDARRDAVARCAGCGRERRAPLAELLEPSDCPACGRRGDFVLARRCP